MKLNKAFRYRLYPNKLQQELIQKTFGCCRFIYNKMLNDKIEYYKETKQTLNNTPAQYKQEFQFLKEVDSQALSFEQMHLQSAYKNFFRDKKIGFPKFKSKKHSKMSYTTSYVYLTNNKLKLGKLGVINFKYHREIPDGYTIKSATISQKASGRYYISILTEYEADVPQVQINIDNGIGLDYSSHNFYVDSNGNQASNRHFFREVQEKLAKEQRKLSKMLYGSNNYHKQKEKVGRIQEYIENQRKDFIEKLSTKLSNEYDIVCVEDINLQNISQSLRLGKSTMDNGFGIFRVRLEQKLQLQGKKLVKIDKWFPSSKMCRFCGTININLKLSDRIWKCDCGKEINRDENAAINILNEGLRLLYQ